jgi:hypothetical protein
MKRMTIFLIALRFSILFGVIFISAGTGRGYMAVRTGPIEGYPSVRFFAIDPSAPQTVYTGTSNGVFKNADGGDDWMAANKGLPWLRR